METQRCSATGCERPAAVALQKCRLCREHFIAACYEHLEGCARRLQERPFREADGEAVRQLLAECLGQAADLAQNAADLGNLERAQLLDIMLWAGEVSQRLRRSDRRAGSVPIRLRSEKPGRPWEEQSQAQILSRHGAMVECTHAVETGELLEVLRLDTGQQAQARVVWNRPKVSGRLEIGLEFVDAVALWDPD